MSPDEHGSYRIGEAQFPDVSAELERLRVQAEVLWPEEAAAFERHGLRDGMRVLEAGCGPGFVTRLLLEHLPTATVTGLDLDPAMLEVARKQLGGCERARFVESSAAATGLPGASFDAVLARFLLQHVPNVPEVLAELRRVLRPGGRLVVVDSDFTFSNLFDPEPEFARDLLDAVAENHRRHGGDGHVGRKLPRLLRDGGFESIVVSAVVAHSVVVGRGPIRGVIPGQALDHLESAGLISGELAADARGYLAAVDAGEVDFEGLLLYLVVSGSAPG
jgi:SAM-dependent methyltransferase